MKKCYVIPLIMAASLFLTGCGSSSTDSNNATSISKSNLRIELIETSPSPHSPAGIELKLDYDQSVLQLPPDINQNASGSVSLTEALAKEETYMMVYDNEDILTLNLLNARGFNNGEKVIGIDFDVIKGEPGINSYKIVQGTLKLFDLNGEELSNVEAVLTVNNR